MKRLLWIVLIAILVGGLGTLGVLRLVYGKTAADFDESMVSGATKRTYQVHLPDSAPEKGAPLLIVLHGVGATGDSTRMLTRNGLNRLADQEGLVVVYPDGIARQWNDGQIKSFFGSQGRPDDVRFISDLIDKMADTRGIDRGRVYVAGISNGGAMAERLALDLPDRVTAIAVVAMTLPKGMEQHPSTPPIPVLLINGTEDPVVPWGGGEITFLGKRGQVLSAEETARFWVRRCGCAERPVVTTEPDRDPKDGTRVEREYYGGGKNGTEVLRYTVTGGGHTWPGGMQYLPESVIGRTSRDIDANQVIWSFFKGKTRG
ncbi:MAG: hypothetical protein HPY50_14350 [Firmicutes bacterium]|nr:hypothetical protein [Bacillota bacterium]